ncbi:MAG: hypothetical protein AVDCRST_MAG89-4871 [uncultured Gemmatimonadetes bacterium]|uniref:Uncharacterized protein n=1 Tax=uncultured Gemmatimonadota bacterium TaxID=203437 RepID=A0A6J4N0N6_9BACT|nr:MAG: hypothetical protein AVDCRST_MAG89-4871 [uncultured Gemmatimonadota bacterium]
MNLLKGMVAAAAVGVIVAAFQDTETGGWLPLGGTPGGGMGPDSPEPVLGYDGMDRDTLIDFLGAANLDRGTLLRIQAYEMANQGRGVVLDAVADLLG